MKRLVLIFLLCLVNPVLSQDVIPIGQNKWFNGTDTLGVLSTFEHTYEYNGNWYNLNTDFVEIGDDVWGCENYVKQSTYFMAPDTVRYVYTVNDVRHVLDLRTTHLIRVNAVDSSFTILQEASVDSFTIVDNSTIRLHGLFYGVDKDIHSTLPFYQERYIFSPEAVDSLRKIPNMLGNYIGTATRLGVDSLNLSLSLLGQIFGIDDKVITAGDVWAGTLFNFSKAPIIHNTEGIVGTVQKFFTKYNNYWYLVELMPVTPLASLPVDTISHNLSVGYWNTGSGTGQQNIENVFACGGVNSAMTTNGTVDSVRFYVYADTGPSKGTYARLMLFKGNSVGATCVSYSNQNSDVVVGINKYTFASTVNLYTDSVYAVAIICADASGVTTASFFDGVTNGIYGTYNITYFYGTCGFITMYTTLNRTFPHEIYYKVSGGAPTIKGRRRKVIIGD